MEYISTTLSEPRASDSLFQSDVEAIMVMIGVACFFLYLAIRQEFEPLLLVPIAFGMLLVNIYPDIMLHAGTDSANGVGGSALLFLYIWMSGQFCRL